MSYNDGPPKIGDAALRRGRHQAGRQLERNAAAAQADINSVVVDATSTVRHIHHARLIAKGWMRCEGDIVQMKTLDWPREDGPLDAEWLEGKRITSIDPRFLYGEHRHPIRFKINSSSCLGATVPRGFSASQAEKEIGQIEARVIDVEDQEFSYMSLREYRNYFENDRLPIRFRVRYRHQVRKPTYNLLALPLFPEERYAATFGLPYLAREHDFTITRRDLSWNEWKTPMLLCLMFAKANSYDDWHVEPTGTLSWYKVVEGRLEFKFLPPLQPVITAYDSWRKNSIATPWFPDLVPEARVQKLTLCQGESLIIPAGWLVCIHNEVNTIAVSGSLAIMHSVEQHIQAAIRERDEHIAPHYRYTKFERCCWLVAMHARKADVPPHTAYIDGLRRMCEWLRDEFRLRNEERDAGMIKHWEHMLICIPDEYHERLMEMEADLDSVLGKCEAAKVALEQDDLDGML